MLTSSPLVIFLADSSGIADPALFYLWCGTTCERFGRQFRHCQRRPFAAKPVTEGFPGRVVEIVLSCQDHFDLEEIAILAGALREQDVGARSPLCATELPGGERLQICLPLLVPAGMVSITIRKPGSTVSPLAAAKGRYQSGRWNQWDQRKQTALRNYSELLGLYDFGNLQAFLEMAVRAKLTILLCGATNSGKTTVSKTLFGAIPAHERLITIEDTLELVIPSLASTTSTGKPSVNSTKPPSALRTLEVY